LLCGSGSGSGTKYSAGDGEDDEDDDVGRVARLRMILFRAAPTVLWRRQLLYILNVRAPDSILNCHGSLICLQLEHFLSGEVKSETTI
jgi:hypothetical protein